jgi:DNA-binding response OmpR family regulator
MGRASLTETFSAVELPRAIETAINRSIGIAGTKPVAVIAEYPAHLPAVQGHQDELVQIITSLVSETMSLMDQGEINISAELLPAGDELSTQEVLDGDPGELIEGGPWAIVHIAATDSESLIRELDRLLSALKKESEQPRIGRDGYSILACKGLIEEFGGQFWVEGLPGNGIRLNFALPLRAAFLADADLSSLRRAVETRISDTDDTTQTILLLTEEQGLRDLLSQDLEEAGYRVISVADGANLLALARTEQPDLILLDLVAREPTGFDVAMVLKQDTFARNIPLLFLTSVSDPEAGLRMGAIGFMIRPDGTGRLLSAIDAVLVSGINPSSRVLIIEPDDAVRETMILMIQAQGYRVTEARGAEEAIALAERIEPSLVLVNSELTHERDYWLLRSLRQLSDEIDIFVLADVISEEEGRAALSRGASGYSETGKLREILEDRKDRLPGQE